MKKSHSTTEAPGAPAFLSQAIESNGFIFVAGQVHVTPDNTLAGDTTEEKLAQIMRNIESILKAAGATLDDIVKVVIYVTDLGIMPNFNKAYPTYFKEPYPVREAVCVKALPLGADIEISVVAQRNS